MKGSKLKDYLTILIIASIIGLLCSRGNLLVWPIITIFYFGLFVISVIIVDKIRDKLKKRKFEDMQKIIKKTDNRPYTDNQPNIKKLGSKNDLKNLTKALTSDDIYTRRNAASELSKIADESTLKDLENALKDEDRRSNTLSKSY